MDHLDHIMKIYLAHLIMSMAPDAIIPVHHTYVEFDVYRPFQLKLILIMEACFGILASKIIWYIIKYLTDLFLLPFSIM